MIRRAPNANATQEVRLEDVLESTELRAVGKTQEVRAVDILAEFPIDDPHGMPDARDETPSIAPFAIDVDARRVSWPRMDARRAESTVDLEAPPPPRHLRRIVAGAMVFSGLILGGAALRTAMTSDPTNVASASATHVLVHVATKAMPAPPAKAEPAIPSAPLAGTIAIGPRARPLIIDGKAMTPSTAVVVPCGEHVVRVGKDKAQTVEVPCGGTLVIKRAGRASR